MALLRALRRSLPPLASPAASLLRRAPAPAPRPLRPLPLLDPIGPRPFSAAAAARAPEMGASLFKGLTETRFPKRRPGFESRRKRASLRPKGALLSSLPFRTSYLSGRDDHNLNSAFLLCRFAAVDAASVGRQVRISG
jgi:hypothetical protein